jgi:cell volume regulation protein A
MQIVEAGFPKGASIVLIGRGNEFIVPNGGTVLESGDRLLVLADKDNLGETRKALDCE